MNNQTSITEFLLVEFSAARELQMLHFFTFLVLYLTAVTGNLLIISAVLSDRRLHKPMYFFLMNLAIQDLGTVSVLLPKSMANSLFKTRLITYSGCVAQVFLFLFFAGSDFFLLTVMAYDRYVAICHPLQYEMIMDRKTCMQVIVGVWLSGLIFAVLHTSSTFATPFCSNTVNQFFCEISQLLKLYCPKVYQIETIVCLISIAHILSCLLFVMATYILIFKVVLKIPSVQGRKKAFSTCLPHFIVFSTVVLTCCITYLRPSSNTSSYTDWIYSILYSTLPHVLNPVIYSLRNREIKVALSKLFL